MGLRTDDLEGDARKTWACADIEKRGGQLPAKEPGRQNGINIVFLNHAVELIDAGQIICGILFPEKFVVLPQPFILQVC